MFEDVASSGHIDALKFLMKSVDPKDITGNGALFLAILTVNMDIVKILLKMPTTAHQLSSAAETVYHRDRAIFDMLLNDPRFDMDDFLNHIVVVTEQYPDEETAMDGLLTDIKFLERLDIGQRRWLNRYRGLLN